MRRDQAHGLSQYRRIGRVYAHADTEFDKMMERGDIDGAATWLRIAKAIHDTQRETPRPGEQRH